MNTIVMAVDPALRHTGIAILQGEKVVALYHLYAGKIKDEARILAFYKRHFERIIEKHKPKVVAYENGVFFKGKQALYSRSLVIGVLLSLIPSETGYQEVHPATVRKLFNTNSKEDNIKVARVFWKGAKRKKYSLKGNAKKDTYLSDVADATLVGMGVIKSSEK